MTGLRLAVFVAILIGHGLLAGCAGGVQDEALIVHRALAPSRGTASPMEIIRKAPSQFVAQWSVSTSYTWNEFVRWAQRQLGAAYRADPHTPGQTRFVRVLEGDVFSVELMRNADSPGKISVSFTAYAF
jgi:hypothetical protein